ncbi:MAG: DUF423 domain-containing protein [Candidatus Neomarinimicrobiota bacterium]
MARSRCAPPAQPDALAAYCGTALFSGSLYLLAVTERRWLGAVTPLGGTLLLAGWLALAAALWQA